MCFYVEKLMSVIAQFENMTDWLWQDGKLTFYYDVFICYLSQLSMKFNS
jgi:hypothetical protein